MVTFFCHYHVLDENFGASFQRPPKKYYIINGDFLPTTASVLRQISSNSYTFVTFFFFRKGQIDQFFLTRSTVTTV